MATAAWAPALMAVAFSGSSARTAAAAARASAKRPTLASVLQRLQWTFTWSWRACFSALRWHRSSSGPPYLAWRS